MKIIDFYKNSHVNKFRHLHEPAEASMRVAKAILF